MVLLVLVIHPFLANAEPIAENGVLDLRGMDLSTSGVVNLKGDWEVYWNQLITPGTFDQKQETPNFIHVPSSWHQLLSETQKKSFQNFATFRLQVLLDKNTDLLALNVVHIFSNFDIYVNGILVSSFGDLYDKNNSIADKRHPILITNPFSEEPLEIVIHVSNYETYMGGVFRPIYLGTYQNILSTHMIRLGTELFLAGSIFIIGLYHFGIFFFRRKDKTALFFGILCLLIAIRVFFMGSRFAVVLLPDLNLSLTLTIEFVSLYLSLAIFATFFYSLFPDEFSLIGLKIIIAISVIMSLMALRIYQTFPAHTHFVFETFTFVSLGYFCYVLKIALKQKREGAKIILFGLLAILVTAVNDALHGYHTISTTVLMPFGLFIYILLQAFYLSKRSALNLIRIEHLSAQLTEMNLNLESWVEERTEELHIINDQLRTEIQEHTKTAKELLESKKQAEKANQAKSAFLANVSHELRTPMHGILGFANLGRVRINNISQTKLLEYLDEIHQSASRLLYLLNDLLDLSKLESGKMEYTFRKAHLYDVVGNVVKELATIAADRRIQLDAPKPDFNDQTKFDFDKMIQVVRNLVSNAIKFSAPNSTINIGLNDYTSRLEVFVKDRGIGVPDGEVEAIFDKFTQSSLTKNGAGGTGLGLAISRQIIIDHQGSITVTNAPDGGAIFTFSIPKNY